MITITPTPLGLTPSSLNLSGNKIKISPIKNYADLVKDEISSKALPEHLKLFLYDIMDLSTGRKKKFNRKLAAKFTAAELMNIAKDFGEVSGAAWFALDVGGKAIEFPAKANEPLIDYYIWHGYKRLKVSAKAKLGSAPTLKGLVPTFKAYYNNTKNENLGLAKITETILTFEQAGVVEGILFLSKFLNENYSCDGYKMLQKITGIGTPTKQNLNNLLLKLDPDSVKVIFEPMFKAMKRYPSGFDSRNNSTDSVHKAYRTNKNKLYGIITSPLAYHVSDLMNANEGFNRVLGDVVSTVNMSQVYMYLNKTGLRYRSVKVQDRPVVWDPGQISVIHPDNKKMGMKVK